MNKRRKRWPKGSWMIVKREELIEQMLDERFSLDRLARYAGCSKGMVSHLTTGRRKTCSPELAENIAEALGVNLKLLFVPQVSTQLGRNDKRMKTGVAA